MRNETEWIVYVFEKEKRSWRKPPRSLFREKSICLIFDRKLLLRKSFLPADDLIIIIA